MPAGDKGIGGGQPDLKRTPESAKQYDRELKRMIDGRYNHPSIIAWVVFNEGWGQFDTDRVTAFTKLYDPTRLVDDASGWNDRGVGDLIDMHDYPGPGARRRTAGGRWCWASSAASASRSRATPGRRKSGATAASRIKTI